MWAKMEGDLGGGGGVDTGEGVLAWGDVGIEGESSFEWEGGLSGVWRRVEGSGVPPIGSGEGVEIDRAMSMLVIVLLLMSLVRKIATGRCGDC